MHRIGGSSYKALKGHVCNRSLCTSLVSRKASFPSALFGWLTGERSSAPPPLYSPFPNINNPPILPDYVEPGKTMITTLKNGLKIASEMSPTPAASIGLYVDCGSVYETPACCGVTHLLEKMAFKSTLNRSHFRVVREVEAIGGNVTASASREQMVYTFDALKTFVPEMVELLVDTVRNPVFLDWEVSDQLVKLKAEIKELSNNPQGLLLEAIHQAGFSGALANPLLAPETALDRLHASLLEEFVSLNYTAPRMVLAASGVSHDELVSVAAPLLSDLPAVPAHETPVSEYIGGEYRWLSHSEATHVTLAFEVPGGWRSEKEALVLTVLQMLMGGGGSFSAGGPGKGMHSRLYLRVLNAYHQMQSFSAFNSIYNNTGLFGIYATTESGFVSKAVDIAVKELLSIAKPGEVREAELDRAKKSTKSAILMNLESRAIVSEDIGRQVLTYGERKSLDWFLGEVDEITVEDITRVAQKILSSPLTMASYGDVSKVPHYATIKRRFHAD